VKPSTPRKCPRFRLIGPPDSRLERTSTGSKSNISPAIHAPNLPITATASASVPHTGTKSPGRTGIICRNLPACHDIPLMNRPGCRESFSRAVMLNP
jgi:hypothetical protein